MPVNQVIFKELIKRGYSLEGKRRIWDVANAKLWYVTPELIAGYLALRKYSLYRRRVVDDEIELLQKHAKHIIEQLGKHGFNLIDLGCGEGSKASVFIKSLPPDMHIRYCPVDINSTFLRMARERVNSLKLHSVTTTKPLLLDFIESPYALGIMRNSKYQQNLLLLLGETISHYDIHDALFKLSSTMFPGDFLIIGNGFRTGKRFVNLAKYKDQRFNNWFINIMHGLGFEDNEVSVDVRFAHGRLEGFYRVLVDKTVTSKGRSVHFKKGDEVTVATQYKFYERELKKYCSMYFCDVDIFKNREQEYCLIVCKK